MCCPESLYWWGILRELQKRKWKWKKKKKKPMKPEKNERRIHGLIELFNLWKHVIKDISFFFFHESWPITIVLLWVMGSGQQGVDETHPQAKNRCSSSSSSSSSFSSSSSSSISSSLWTQESEDREKGKSDYPTFAYTAIFKYNYTLGWCLYFIA